MKEEYFKMYGYNRNDYLNLSLGKYGIAVIWCQNVRQKAEFFLGINTVFGIAVNEKPAGGGRDFRDATMIDIAPHLRAEKDNICKKHGFFTNNVDPAKVKVVPYGANADTERTFEQMQAGLAARSNDRCELLFIGVEWERKGADIALETAVELNRRGIPTRLHLVGCQPPGEVPDCVVLHGFISKKSPEGRAKMEALLSSSNFLIVPSRAECFGLVFAEASSFGLPSLAADVGGIPTVVRDGINGRLLPLSARGEIYADAVVSLMEDSTKYREMAHNAFTEYETRLNWRVAGQAVVKLLENI